MDERRDRGEPVVRVKLYVEGGGDAKSQKSRLRQGFRQFLEQAGLQGKMPGIVACGPRDTAYDRFGLAHVHSDTIAILVVDSEGPVTASQPWKHLKNRDGWHRPPGAQEDQCHLMVQVMEAWFLADRKALSAYYGKGFRAGALPKRKDIENVLKADIFRGLKQATRNTTKGPYDKGSHGFAIIGKLSPDKVQKSSPYAKRLVDTLSALADTQR